jgi:tripartite-type tricarboxylate transporter receptor subunit TctC
VIDKLNAEINRQLQTPDVRERFQTLGVSPLGGTPEALGKYLAFEITRWAKLIRETGVKLK